MEQKKSKLNITNIVLGLFIIVIIVVVGNSLARTFNKLKGARHIDVVEVNEYRGERLDSINDFRENSIKGPQYVDIDSYRLKVGGLVDNPKQFTYDEIINGFESHQKVVTLNCVEGWSVKILWEGIYLKDLFAQFNIDPKATTVIFHAVDDYTTSHPLNYLIDNNIIMAYKMNDAVIPPERGYPFMLVAESKWGYKWIKWIDEIELSDNENYRGFWEKRGYSDEGHLDEPFLD